MSQSNTRSGSIRVLAGEDLTGKADYLCKMAHDGGVPEVKLPPMMWRTKRATS